MHRPISAPFLALLSLLSFSGGPALAAPGRLETATFAAGCFWGTEEFFRKVPGVVETRVGYTGGKTANPTYEDSSTGRTGHAESVEVRFDPAQVSYEKLLVLFFEMHDPTTANRQGNDRGSQYRSAIFYHGEGQKKVAHDVMARIEASGAWKGKLTTELAPAGTFYPAEDYHQKYLVKNPGGYDNHYFRGLDFGPGLPRVEAPGSSQSPNPSDPRAQRNGSRIPKVLPSVSLA